MTSRQVGRVNQQSKGENPLVSGVLQRAAVRAVADKEGEATQEVELGALSQSRFVHDFSQVPIGGGGLPIIQAKLMIGAAGDKYEQEADRVAKDVVSRMNAPVSSTVQREEISKVEEEELQKKPIVQRVSDVGGMAASSDLEASIQGARGSGQPLSPSVREPIEREFGADFSGVRVHTDEKSDVLNRSIQAKAFTTGSDIFFRQGAYVPLSKDGQELLVHELTHVVQQEQNPKVWKLRSELPMQVNTSSASAAIQREIYWQTTKRNKVQEQKLSPTEVLEKVAIYLSQEDEEHQKMYKQLKDMEEKQLKDYCDNKKEKTIWNGDEGINVDEIKQLLKRLNGTINDPEREIVVENEKKEEEDRQESSNDRDEENKKDPQKSSNKKIPKLPSGWQGKGENGLREFSEQVIYFLDPQASKELADKLFSELLGELPADWKDTSSESKKDKGQGRHEGKGGAAYNASNPSVRLRLAVYNLVAKFLEKQPSKQQWNEAKKELINGYKKLGKIVDKQQLHTK